MKIKNLKKAKPKNKFFNFKEDFSQRQKQSKNLLKFKNKSFFESLVNIDAFIGDTYLRSHFSIYSLIYAYRNNHDIYEAVSSYNGLKRALQFLKLQKHRNLIFVGNPMGTSEKCKTIFANYKIKFFPSDLWIPGFISKNLELRKSTLVIYDSYTNSGAKNEALSLNMPIVGFTTKYGNMDGVDYPVCINFENCGNWYTALWNAFFSGRFEEKKKK